MAGSTSRQSAFAASMRRESWTSVDGERLGVGEEAAVEAQDVAVEDRGEAALVHRRPRGRQSVGATCSGVPRRLVRRSRKAFSGMSRTSSANIEKRQRIRKRATRSGAWPCASKERPSAARRPAISRVTRAAVRAGSSASGSDQTKGEAVANLRVAQVFEADAKAGGVGEVGVVLAGAGEVGEKLDLLANGDGDQKGRIFVRKRPGIAFGLATGPNHRIVPGRAGRRSRGRVGKQRELRRRHGERPALGFENEVAALVEVDAAGGAGARKGHRILEAVAVNVRGIGAVRADQADQVDQERLRSREFAGIGVLPMRNEFVGRGRGRHCRMLAAAGPRGKLLKSPKP